MNIAKQKLFTFAHVNHFCVKKNVETQNIKDYFTVTAVKWIENATA